MLRVGLGRMHRRKCALRGRGPLQLVWQQSIGEQSLALRLEYRLKQWPKARKEALILGQVALPELTSC